MPTKLAIAITTIVVYSMTLLCFQQQRAIAQMRYERLSRQTVLGWDLTNLAHQLTAAVAESEPRLSDLVTEEVSPLEAYVRGECDPVICRTIRSFNEDIDLEQSERLARLIEGTATMYGVDPYLVAALVSQESAFYEDAVSPVGAMGLGQLMPETAADLGVDPRDAEQNLDGCVRYLAMNLDLWAGSSDPVALALASYNAGPGAVERFGGVPPYEETQNYVAIIKFRYDQLRASRA